MAFIFKNENIKEKRCQIFLTALRDTITQLLILEENAANLIDQTYLKNSIASMATNIGETSPVLPFGDELVLNWNSLKFDYTSLSKFLELFYNSSETNPSNKIVYDKIKNSVLQPSIAGDSDINTDVVTILPATGVKLINGKAYFPNLEKYEFDYKSYEILNEVYRALSLILDSVEDFYSTFYTEERSVFFGIEDIPAVQQINNMQYIMVYDTREMDEEIDGRVTIKAQEIIDPVKREATLEIYRSTRDIIKFWNMFTAAPKLEAYIERMLFAVNGSRTYDIHFNQNLRVLEVEPLDGGVEGQNVVKHSAEEVLFPFHNKALLNQFTQGLNSIW